MRFHNIRDNNNLQRMSHNVFYVNLFYKALILLELCVVFVKILWKRGPIFLYRPGGRFPGGCNRQGMVNVGEFFKFTFLAKFLPLERLNTDASQNSF